MSCRNEVNDNIKGLNLGANDNITRPFNYIELVERIQVALRYHSKIAVTHITQIVTLGDLKIDFNRVQIDNGRRETTLAPIENRLLCEQLKHAGKTLD